MSFAFHREVAGIVENRKLWMGTIYINPTKMQFVFFVAERWIRLLRAGMFWEEIRC
jgi:hypothetical protein